MTLASLVSAYVDGCNAGYRIGPHKDARSTPDCPYNEGTPEAEEWWDGFGDATEDILFQKELD